VPRADDHSAIQAAEAVARRSYGKLVAILAARTRDVAGAEDALSEAFAAALADWPVNGAPNSPEAWLLATARRKMIDAIRHRKVGTLAAEHLRLMAEELEAAAKETPDIPDARLALMFACAHPEIEPGIRAPLILQTILGFDAQAIGSAFLVSPAAMGQRLARAKNRIRRGKIPLRVPERADMRVRLSAVLEAVYAAYTEGWSDPAGADASLRNLAEEAIWLGRLIAALLPNEAEALGLLALMLYSHARLGARRSPAGEFVPLADQDPALWDQSLIDEAETLLIRASAFDAFDRYQLEAAIQSAHVCAAAPVPRIGRRSSTSMTASARSPAHRSPQSTAPSPWPKHKAPRRGWRLFPHPLLAAGFSPTSPIGQRAPNFMQGWGSWKQHAKPINRPSRWKSIPQCAGFCKNGRRNAWRRLANLILPANQSTQKRSGRNRSGDIAPATSALCRLCSNH